MGMSISAGFTTAEIREFVHRYEFAPFGQKAIWLEEQGVSYDRLRRWRSAVFDGDLDRGLIPREGSGVTIPPEKRTGIERQRARRYVVTARFVWPGSASSEVTRRRGKRKSVR